ncbi:MAG: peptide ligase PGM1-related protein [Actinomycetota bacterium]
MTRFRQLQASLVDLWPAMTIRAVGDFERTIVVINSINIQIPDHLAPVMPAYEERFLFLVLALAGGPRTRVVYVTSQPIQPRLIDYYLSLMRQPAGGDLRDRLVLVSLSDGSPRPLVEKILARPLFIERLRRLIGDPRRAVILPFNTTMHEVELAAALSVPVYGPDPSLAHLGTKSGSRRLFAESGVPHPAGRGDVHTFDDVVDALAELRARNPTLSAAMVKLDDSAGGMGNAVVRLAGASNMTDLKGRAAAIEIEDSGTTAERFFDLLKDRGGIVEERIEGTEIRSPSAQLRASPLGEVEILSTHDQVLGGPTGQTFLGCRFPADLEYGALIARFGERIGWLLAGQGVIGRFGIDFVVVRRPAGWSPYAIEINLRNGGTTHPMLTMQALTNGSFDSGTGRFHVDGSERFYVATDHLESPAYHQLTPDDVLDRIEDQRLGWDADSMVGVALHLVSAVAVAGRLGLTAIGRDPSDAEQRFNHARELIEDLVTGEP